jgi:F-type H+-transporting ATPase subunit delta
LTYRTVAARYARALLDVARREGDPRAAENEVASFAALLQGHETLAQVLTNPAIPAQKKAGLVRELAARAGVSPIVAKLLVLLAERDRLVLLPDLLDEYRRRLQDFLNVVRAEVVTAVPLPGDRVEALERALAAMTGRTVSMTASVDPALIGGVVTRIGSVVYDGSVKRQLEKMRETLTQA